MRLRRSISHTLLVIAALEVVAAIACSTTTIPDTAAARPVGTWAKTAPRHQDEGVLSDTTCDHAVECPFRKDLDEEQTNHYTRSTCEPAERQQARQRPCTSKKLLSPISHAENNAPKEKRTRGKITSDQTKQPSSTKGILIFLGLCLALLMALLRIEPTASVLQQSELHAKRIAIVRKLPCSHHTYSRHMAWVCGS